jgi:hypothetical protein
MQLQSVLQLDCGGACNISERRPGKMQRLCKSALNLLLCCACAVAVMYQQESLDVSGPIDFVPESVESREGSVADVDPYPVQGEGDGGPPPKRTPDSVTWTVNVPPGMYYRVPLLSTRTEAASPHFVSKTSVPCAQAPISRIKELRC